MDEIAGCVQWSADRSQGVRSDAVQTDTADWTEKEDRRQHRSRADQMEEECETADSFTALVCRPGPGYPAAHYHIEGTAAGRDPPAQQMRNSSRPGNAGLLTRQLTFYYINVDESMVDHRLLAYRLEEEGL